jgi:AraC family transcriptional regulator
MNVVLPHRGYVFGDVEYEPGAAFGPRMQSSLQLVYVHHGSLVCTVDGRDVPVHAGQGVLLFPGHEERFRFAPDVPTRHGWVERRFEYSAHAHYDGRDPIVGEVHDELESLAIGGLVASQLSGPGAEAARDAVARLLLEAFLVRAGSGAADTGMPPQLARAIAFVDDHWNEHIRLTDLAHTGSVSPTHLNRLFRHHTGTSAMRYLRRYRAERAVRLIETTALTLEKIAELCAFANAFHLSRTVRDEFGQPPAKIRAAQRRTDHAGRNRTPDGTAQQ